MQPWPSSPHPACWPQLLHLPHVLVLLTVAEAGAAADVVDVVGRLEADGAVGGGAVADRHAAAVRWPGEQAAAPAGRVRPARQLDLVGEQRLLGAAARLVVLVQQRLGAVGRHGRVGRQLLAGGRRVGLAPALGGARQADALERRVALAVDQRAQPGGGGGRSGVNGGGGGQRGGQQSERPHGARVAVRGGLAAGRTAAGISTGPPLPDPAWGSRHRPEPAGRGTATSADRLTRARQTGAGQGES